VPGAIYKNLEIIVRMHVLATGPVFHVLVFLFFTDKEVNGFRRSATPYYCVAMANNACTDLLHPVDSVKRISRKKKYFTRCFNVSLPSTDRHT
jgi:hypothetical protein